MSKVNIGDSLYDKGGASIVPEILEKAQAKARDLHLYTCILLYVGCSNSLTC